AVATYVTDYRGCSCCLCWFCDTDSSCGAATVVIRYRYCIGSSCVSCRESYNGGSGSAVAPEVGVGRGAAACSYLHTAVSAAVATYVADYRGCSRYRCWFRYSYRRCLCAAVIIGYRYCIGCSCGSCRESCNGGCGSAVAPEVGVGRGAAACSYMYTAVSTVVAANVADYRGCSRYLCW